MVILAFLLTSYIVYGLPVIWLMRRDIKKQLRLLSALEDVEKGGIFGRLTDFVSLTFRKLFNKQSSIVINKTQTDTVTDLVA